MKKFFAVILIACLLLSCVSALADKKQPPKQPPKGQAPENAPQMLDLDSRGKTGVISQETMDKIKTYMESNRPEGATEGEAPAEPEQPDDDDDDDDDDDEDEPEEPEEPDDDDDDGDDDDDESAEPPAGILGELLKAGVITQEECDAMAAAMPEGAQQ